jgi:hypothetical protein
MEAMELSQHRWIQNMPHQDPVPLLRTVPLPVNKILQAPPRRGPFDVQRGRRELRNLTFLHGTSNHRPEERHMKRGVNAIIRRK